MPYSRKTFSKKRSWSPFNPESYKGKEFVIDNSNPNESEKEEQVKRSFLNLNLNKNSSTKRDKEDNKEENETTKRPKLIEALSPSLSPFSLSNVHMYSHDCGLALRTLFSLSVGDRIWIIMAGLREEIEAGHNLFFSATVQKFCYI